MQLIDLHITLRQHLPRVSAVGASFSLDHEIRQDRIRCYRAPNDARRKRIQRERIPDARFVVTRSTQVMKLGWNKKSNSCLIS